MSVEGVVRWLPRLAVGVAAAVYLYSTLAVIGVLTRATPPEGPVLAVGIFLFTWGGPAYLLYRFDSARAWLLGGRGW